jgi:Domain of unknown function (DUF4192)
MSEPHTQQPVLHLRQPSDLLEAIPYLLGFHPRQSLVIVGLEGKTVVLTTRVDLAELDQSEEPGNYYEGVVWETLQVIAGSGADGVVGVVYDDECVAACGPMLPWPNAWLSLRAGCGLLRLLVHDALLVQGTRWWSYLCDDPMCCPPEGQERAGDHSPAAATATYAGLVALDDRADLLTLLQPDASLPADHLYDHLAELERAAVAASVAGTGARYQRSVKRAIFAAARAGDATLFGMRPSEARRRELCRLAIGLEDVAVRDSVWIAIDHGRLDGRSLWREMARYLPPPYGAAGLFLFGWAEWRGGNAVLARIAAERALETDPGYSAAQLLLGAISHALDPHRTPRLRPPKP